MKNVLVSLALGLAATSLFARGGNDGVRIPARGTQAALVLESIEHSIRSLVTTGTSESSIETASASTKGNLATVSVGLTGGASALFNCALVEELSLGGTVTKKEVRCSRAQ